MPFFPSNLCSAARLAAGLLCRSLVRRGAIAAAGLAALSGDWAAPAAQAQSTALGRYYPLDQTTPPGVAGQWSMVRPGFLPVMQPVRFELPGDEAQVAFFTGPGSQPTTLAAPAIVGLRVSSVYRIRISNLEGYPGVELYPTIEMLDRLHPPRGRELEFAIPITLSAEEIEAAIDGRMVTKVIYLEQPDRAAPIRNATVARNRLATPRDNALALADEAGRPMVILRLGGRVPDAAASDAGFFGAAAPVQFFEPAPTPKEAAQR